jgi:hypothetical protein
LTEDQKKAHDFFKQQGFLPIGIASFPIFKKFDAYSKLQEMSSVIITTWDSVAYNGLYKMIDNYLCSVYFFPGKPIYFALHRPPQNERTHSLKHIVDILFDLSKQAELPFLQIKFIEDCYLQEFQTIDGYHVETEFFEDDNEYVYSVKNLLELSGGKNLNKRTRIKKFIDNPLCENRFLNKAGLSVCEEIDKVWCSEKDCSYCESFSGCEKKVVDIMFKIWDDSIHQGLVGYYDGKPVGYTIWENRPDKTTFMYFGKSNIRDHYIYLIYMMAKNYFAGSDYMNMNEDMGNMGLRTFKRHIGEYTNFKKNICTFTRL